jgi:hypothetical protein
VDYWGRARYRQAHKLPSRRWELAGFVVAVLALLACLALYVHG